MDSSKTPVKLVKVTRVLGRTGMQTQFDMLPALEIHPESAPTSAIVKFEAGHIVVREHALTHTILGSRGGVTQVRVEFMDDQSRSIIRNVKGPGMQSLSLRETLIGSTHV